MEKCLRERPLFRAICTGQSPARAADRIAMALCIGGLLYVLSGFVSPARPKTLYPQPLEPVEAGQKLIQGSAFAAGAVPIPERPNYIHGNLTLYGSFLNGNGESTGSVVSEEFRAVPDFLMFISGYPNRPGNRLVLAVTTSNGKIVSEPVAPFEDTGGKWLLKRVSFRSIEGARSFHIVATDANKGSDGWVGFSLPFLDRQSGGRGGLLVFKQLLFILLALCGSLAALWTPGLMLRHRQWQTRGQLFSPVWLAVPGLLGLAALGTLAWCSPHHISPRFVCRLALAVFFAFSIRFFARVRMRSLITGSELRLFAITLAVITVCLGKSMYSLGPVGELYHGEVSRTLVIGGRSDSRLPYYVSQLVGMRQKTTGPFAGELYGTWTFSDRGQLAALAAAPLVLTGPAKMPDHKPEDPWTLFDPQGFMAYRCAMMVFATATLFSVFGVSQLFLPEEWCLLSVLIAATSPFFIHEVYFTWPKLEAAAFVLLAGYLMIRRRFLTAGLALGLGYMCHPSALLSVPAILCLLLLLPPLPGTHRAWWRRGWRMAVATSLVLAGLAFWLVLWRVANHSDYTQTKFLHFARAAGPLAPNPANWLKYRSDSLINTLVPLHQYLFSASDENVNAVEGPSPPVVRFFVQPWSTVPAAAGYFYFFCLLGIVGIGLVRRPGWTLAVLIVPLLIFAAYMGIDRSGMLKEGLHAWFLTATIFSAVIWWQNRRRAIWLWRVCAIALLARAADLLGMMLVPPIWTQHVIVRPEFAFSDSLALAMICGGTVWLCLRTFRFAWSLESRKSELPMTGTLELNQRGGVLH